MPGEDGRRGLDAVQAGQLQIHQHHVRSVLLIKLQRLRAAVRLRHHPQIVLQFERRRQSAAYHEVIVDQKQSDGFHEVGARKDSKGKRTITTVPCPGALCQVASA